MLSFAKKLIRSSLSLTDSSALYKILMGDFFVLEGSQWISLSDDKCEITFEKKGKQEAVVNIVCPSESVSEIITLDSISNLTRFVDEDGRPCFQWIVKKGKSGDSMEEFGLRFDRDDQADVFANQIAALGQQTATVVAEFSSSLSLVEKTAENEWEVIQEGVTALVSKTKKGEHFLTVQRGQLLLFHSSISKALQIEHEYPISAFLGFTPLDEDLRVLGLNFDDRDTFSSFQETLDSVMDSLGISTKKPIRRAPSVELSPTHSENSDTVMWVDAEEFAATPVKSRRQRRRAKSPDDEDGDVVNRHLQTGRKHSRAIVFSNRNSLSGFQVYNTESLPRGEPWLKSISGFTKLSAINNPTAVMIHQGDSKCLMLDPSSGKDKVFELDLERGQVVNEWTPGSGTSINAILPVSQFAQSTDEQTFLGLNERAVFMMDPRVRENHITGNRVASFNYATNVKLNAAATDASSHIVVGNKAGQIRLFDGERNCDGDLKRAKTLLGGLGDAITHIELTGDGEWILGTCATYLVLVNTVTAEGVSGFEKSIRAAQPITLSLSWSDITKHKLGAIAFTPARFDEKKGIIVTSTGSLAIVWDFAKIKRSGGQVSYSIKPMKNYILDTALVGSSPDCVVAMYEDKLEMARVRK